MGSSLMSTVKRRLNYVYRTVLLDLCLRLASYLICFPHLTCPRALPTMCAQLFAKMDSNTEDCRSMSTLLMGWCPPPFLTSKEPSCTCADREVSLTSGLIDVVLLSQYSSRAQLLPLTLSLACLRKTKLQSTLLDKLPAAQPRDPSTFYLRGSTR